MKYLMLIYGNQEKWNAIPAGEWPEAIAKQEAFNRKYQQTGELIGAYGLADQVNARLVRRQDGAPAVTDGPYLETKEHIGGFWVLEAADLDEALAWGRKAAVACRAPVEVRAVFQKPQGAQPPKPPAAI